MSFAPLSTKNSMSVILPPSTFNHYPSFNCDENSGSLVNASSQLVSTSAMPTPKPYMTMFNHV